MATYIEEDMRIQLQKFVMVALIFPLTTS